VNKNLDKVELTIAEKRVKLHIFEPSKREVWTVVGKGKEHWLDLEEEYCSCKGYYFGRLAGKKICYHLKSAILAKKRNQTEKIIFSDDEYVDFLKNLVSEL